MPVTSSIVCGRCTRSLPQNVRWLTSTTLFGRWSCCCALRPPGTQLLSVRISLPVSPIVNADRVQIQQVLMNLMLNGIEAMRDTGGILTVKYATESERPN